MFGYAVANIHTLTEQEKKRYREIYCGLCGVLRENYGIAARTALTYDMVLLIMILSSLYNLEGEKSMARCVVHPLRTHAEWTSAVTPYAADMNVLFAYHKIKDDLADDGGAGPAIANAVIRRAYETVRLKHEKKCAAVSDALMRLKAIEQSGEALPDAASGCFGEMMRQAFMYREDEWSDMLGAMAFALGKFIYIMDAAVDLKKDMRRGAYNPLREMYRKQKNIAGFRPLLEMLIGQCAMVFEKLPIVQDAPVIKNILYSGIWLKYDAACAKIANEGKDESRSV